eukprot:CAMPEP_0115010868 /NCGR_PEP_ID=MMETSP0216-20121206/23605_1 /TAXON_ID=223996 /ORGANISM="Protocruzia adherens, Strain Boccale" /LENGTH=578 /DNA_ID=CAMNT_0002379231 /DNA_START=194 /DNA_END=1930 /DNA_ORIENTATION=+
MAEAKFFTLDNVVDFLSNEQYNQLPLVELFQKGDEVQKKSLVDQLNQLNGTYPGGLLKYLTNARQLLADSKNNVNPFADYTLDVPTGESVEFGSSSFMESEQIGLEQMPYMAFVLVAGGLGERLGYSSIKIGLPTELVTGTTYLEYYIEHILAFQDKHGKGQKLPLCIMTSDDTHALTIELLEKNDYFGMGRDQLTIVKQEKVPALVDNEAHLSFDAEKFTLETKPHGHGDVHTLLHQHEVVSTWKEQGKKWIMFFQDTNALVFKAIPALTGISTRRNFAMNTITIPRMPGEACGAICSLTHKKTGRSLTINVEYNQISALLGEGGDLPDESGYSMYPGNTNALLFSLEPYSKALIKTGGGVPEFVNPKYADASKTKFKSATRLECMQQDFPRLFEDDAQVGFSQFERWMCFSAVKNNVVDAAKKAESGLFPECAGSGEQDIYTCSKRYLEGIGISCGDGKSADNYRFANIPLEFGARVIIKPSFAASWWELKTRFSGANSISKNSVAVFAGDTHIENLTLDGGLKTTGAVSKIKDLTIKAEEPVLPFIPLGENEEVADYIKIRGYKTVPKDADFETH